MPLSGIKAGTLRKTALIQANNPTTQDSYGARQDSWKTVRRVRASVEPTGVPKTLVGQQIIATETHVLTMRFWGRLNESMRILFEGRIFQITWIVNWQERRVFNLVGCRELKLD